MIFKNILPLLVTSGICFSSCQNTQKINSSTAVDPIKTEQSIPLDSSTLIGSWKDQSPAALDFTLFADGKAQSDNMSTLLFQKWSLKNNELILIAESIGNKQSSIDTIIYHIEKLEDRKLIVKEGNMLLEFNKLENSNEAQTD